MASCGKYSSCLLKTVQDEHNYEHHIKNCVLIQRWAVDLIKEPIEFFEVAPSTSPTESLAPTTETRSPTLSPTVKPTGSPTVRPPCGVGCPTGSNSLLPIAGCLGFYYCVSGAASGVIPCPTGTLFDVGIQACNWASSVTCQCSSGSSPTAPPPTTTTTSPTSPTSPTTVTNPDLCSDCPVSNWDMVGASDCSGFYHCISGLPSNFIACPRGTLWSASIKGCDYPWRTECACLV